MIIGPNISPLRNDVEKQYERPVQYYSVVRKVISFFSDETFDEFNLEQRFLESLFVDLLRFPKRGGSLF